MRPPPRETSARACWNCDQADDRAIAVTLRRPAGREATICLCRRCYSSDYVPLAASYELRGLATRPDPTVLELRPPGGRSGPA